MTGCFLGLVSFPLGAALGHKVLHLLLILLWFVLSDESIPEILKILALQSTLLQGWEGHQLGWCNDAFHLKF